MIASARWAAPVLGASAALVGCSVLLGWAFGIDVLHAVFPRQVSTIPNTAAGFVLCGVALVLATLYPRERRVSLAARALAGILVLLAALTLAEHFTGTEFGIDGLLFGVLRVPSPESASRMALNTCVAFILAGTALVLLDVRTGHGRRPTEALAGLTFLVAYLALVGRLYGVPQLFAVGPRASGMAPLTAITFLALSVGIFLARPARGLASLVAGANASGVLSRRMLPAVLLVPTALGALWIYARRADVLAYEGGVSLFVILVVATFAVLAVRSALAVRTLERQREVLLEREQRARSEAEAANRAKMEFLTNMSHELRTPLNAIAGYSELIETGVYGEATSAQREALSRIRRNQRHLLGLINDVLNFAKLEAGRVDFHVRETSLAELLASVESLVLPLVQAKGLRLEHARSSDEVVVHADAEKARQILLNLLSNAVKFTPRGGTVRLYAEARPARVRVHVSDTGPGIAAERLESVFEPFVQLERGLTHTPEGAGLGLAISRDLAHGMGGDLTATSAVGEGSVFTLELRRARTAALVMAR